MRRVLVIGATGKVGRHVVDGLRKEGAEVRALARNPDTAGLPVDVEVVAGDLTSPASLRPAMDGIDTVFLLWPSFAADGAAAVVDLIAEHASRIVYLSAMSVRDDLPPEATGVWGAVERLIERTGLEWTFLRAGGFAGNTLEWAEQIRADGVVRAPFPGASRSLIRERDIAAVAVRALVGDGHVGAKYVLTGPEVVSQADQVRIIGEVIGRPLEFDELPREVARTSYWPPGATPPPSTRRWTTGPPWSPIPSRSPTPCGRSPARRRTPSGSGPPTTPTTSG